MSTFNEYGYSVRMNPKLKNLLDNYKPEDVSALTASRNKKPLWSQNTIRKMKGSGKYHGESTDTEKVNTCLSILTIIIVLWALFNI